jgi:hypothetical protein
MAKLVASQSRENDIANGCGTVHYAHLVRLWRKHQGWKGALSCRQDACYTAVEVRIAQAIM